VVATDVLSEGLNMQDCDTIINYDLHWNPVRLIQRFGRIDRIGSTHDKVYGLNFLPESKLDKHLDLKDRLEQRIKEIQETIGEDSAILDPTEKVNEEAMYAIYDNQPANLDLFEPDEPMGLGEAEGILRQLRAEDPAEFDRIASLRDGIRSGMNSLQPGMFVLCQAGTSSNFSLLILKVKSKRGMHRPFLADSNARLPRPPCLYLRTTTRRHEGVSTIRRRSFGTAKPHWSTALPSAWDSDTLARN
jgi:hypothetical protein